MSRLIAESDVDQLVVLGRMYSAATDSCWRMSNPAQAALGAKVWCRLSYPRFHGLLVTSRRADSKVVLDGSG